MVVKVKIIKLLEKLIEWSSELTGKGKLVKIKVKNKESK